MQGGHIYVAPPDSHLLVSEWTLVLSAEPPLNGHRPAIDPLFRSAAREFGSRAVGVILSGVLDDGAAGLAAVKAAGGKTVVQTPSDALYEGMPLAAIRRAQPDHVVPAVEIARLLVELVASPPPDPALPHVDARDEDDELIEQAP
jgi:two-component system, chemotaxis family, protein-glutamate methylesterase/glutaminase